MKWLFSPYSPSLPLRKIGQSWLISGSMLRLRTGELHSRGLLGFPPELTEPLEDHEEYRYKQIRT
jgi:hypothetical protein